MIEELAARYIQLRHDTNRHPPATDSGTDSGADLTVVFDTGKNSAGNFTDPADTGLGWVGTLPPSDHSGLLAVPARRRRGRPRPIPPA